jgi:hypothetical protein
LRIPEQIMQGADMASFKPQASIGAIFTVMSGMLALGGCKPGSVTVTPVVTSIDKSVVTLHKASVMAGCMATDLPAAPVPASPAPIDQLDPQAWWDALPAANHQFPFAGWSASQPGPGGCRGVRSDSYRAVTVFNLANATNLKGLVTKAELVVSTRALPPAMRDGGVITAGPLGVAGSITLFCPTGLGGAGSLVRFGPNAAVPGTSAAGGFNLLGADPFPAGTNAVYSLPTFLLPGGFPAGPIANASDPSTIARTGTGGATITTDVTSQINAALNGNFASIAWMLTSNFEGSLPAAFNVPGTFDCRTSYDMELKVTHL